MQNNLADTIEIKEWMKVALGSIRCAALDSDHPMHPYNQALAQGVIPEDFGIENPLSIEFDHRSRADLIHEILQLRKLI